MLEIGALLKPGVYLLLYRREVVYVGKSTFLLTRLYQHRNNYRRSQTGKGPVMAGAKAILFDDMKIWPCERSALDALERELIAKYMPKYNTQLVPKIKHEFKVMVNGIEVVLNGAPKVAAQPRIERRI